MTSRLLLVEPSTTMRFVLDNYVQSLGHSVVSLGDYHEAVEALREQFQSFDDDFDAVILGWPSVAVREADTLTSLLEQDDFQNVPVVVMSTDQRAETRAWVADRPNSSMLAWKAYESVSELLEPLEQSESNGIEISSSALATHTRTPVKFDNSDTGVLLIDDSPSIRESLTKVLTIHGYRIEAVATQQEALEVVKKQSIDIAIVDFYLQDETGDEVCRALLNEEPSLMCAILTSAYSDPIIKLSLRAGAVDCLFKNEAGELLLARIDALSRVVRQRKALKIEQHRLDRMVDSLAGATLLLNDDQELTYVSLNAADQLGFADRRELIGQPAARIFDPERLPAVGLAPTQAQWANAEQETIDVMVRLVALSGSSERMLNFDLGTALTLNGSALSTPMPESANTAQNAATGLSPNGNAALPLPAGAASVSQESEPEATLVPIPTPQFAQAAQPFLRQLSDYLATSNDNAEPVSALVLGVMLRGDDGSVRPVSEHPVIAELVHDSIMAIYRRENHVVQLTEHHYSFLLRHLDAPQSYLLTRKIMQLCNDTEVPEEFSMEGQLCVNGCLLALKNHHSLASDDFLARAMSGLRAVDVRGVNQALLLDLRRMLPVYPAT